MAEMRVSKALAAAMRTMPAEAITGVIEALVEATQPRIPTLFHQVLSMFSEECQDLNSNHQLFMTFKSAMLHLLKESDSSVEELDSLVQIICVPLMLTNSAKASKLFAEAVAMKCSWDYALSSIIPSCSAALNANSQVLEKKALNGSIEVNRAGACQIVTELLTVAVKTSSESFCGNLVEFYWSPCLRLLSESRDDTIRNVAMQTLLPSLLKAIKVLSLKNARYFKDLHDLWICCKVLLFRGGSQRRDAYNILTMLVDDFEKIEPDIRELDFWEEIQAGLVDEDTLTRKRALFVLKHALNFTEETKHKPSQLEGSKRERWAQQEAASLGVKAFDVEHEVLTSSQQWASFFLLYDTLDEYGIHLVEAAWENQISALARCIIAKDTADCLNFSWISLLFERGFKHGNPQVRRLIVQSFFTTKWSCVIHQKFVLGPLVHALNDPVHHKDFGVNDAAYTSEVGVLAAKFFQNFSRSLDAHDSLHFINTLSKAIRDHSRAGLMTIASCMEAVALGCSKDESLNSTNTEVLLESLRNVVEQSRTHFNPCYRTQVCDYVLKVASSFVKLPELKNSSMLSYFLGAFPRECFSFHGSLRKSFEFWLNVFPEQTQETLYDGLKAELLSYLKPPSCKTSEYVFVEEDLGSWRREAERWCRMFFLGLTGEQHQLSLFEIVEQYSVDIYHRAYIPVTVPEKVLLLLQAFLVELSCVAGQEFSLLQSSFSKFCDTILGELLSYAEKCVVALAEYELDGPLQLPAALTGRLGGPSQRWLPSQASFAVTKAVIAVETVTKCYSWLFSRVNNGLDSAGVGLWKLSWKLLSVSNEQEGLRAEFQLACLEALAFVCKALPLAFTSPVIRIASEDLNAEITVNCLVNKLLKLYNDIVRKGKLGRSRRAVLTRHKWSCLAELLSLHDINSEGSAITMPNLSVILHDATDSLGSAAEDYFLPLFKSVRWLIHWRAVDKQNNPSEIVWELVRSGWACISDCNKRRIPVLATFLSTFIHPDFFKLPEMHDNEEGPLKWLLGKLIELGARSPRTMRLTALHLTGLWLKYPETTVFYMPELKSMCLYGGDAIDEEFDGEIFDNELASAAKEYASLVQSSDSNLQEVFASTNMFVRVAVAVMIDKLGELVERGPINDYELRVTLPAAATCGRLLLLNLLHAAENDIDLSKELYKKFSTVHRRKIRVWQTLCLLSRFTNDSNVDEVRRILEVCLNRNNMPSVRQYIEIFAVQLYLRFPDLLNEHLVARLMDVNMKAQELSSYVHIAANVIKFVSPALKETVLDSLLPAVLPHMTSHHHNLRTFTQVLLFQVLQPSALENLGPKCLRSISSYLEENVDCKRLRTCVDQFLFKLEPAAASNPRGLFCSQINETNKKEDRHFECVPVSVMDKVTEILNETREELRESMASDALQLSFGDEKNQKQETHKDFQKKIVPKDKEPANGILENMIHEDELIFSMIETKGRELVKIIEGRQELIVVASLIERVPNLAGLARTCEVFKASSLVVHNKSVLEDRQFKLISVTAEQWVPVLEVPEISVNHFLERKKTEGYTILGLEQTANSVSIDRYSFPRKAVLVLGREKDGIPVNIIQTLDACVEIPQLGMIRSLNVHVSGAIAVWEYTKQNLNKN